jgi:Tol biopolymer transport system component
VRRFRLVLIPVGVLLLILLVGNAIVLLGGEGETSSLAKVPHAQAALMLGAQVKPNGRPSTMLADREELVAPAIDAAHASHHDVLKHTGGTQGIGDAKVGDVLVRLNPRTRNGRIAYWRFDKQSHTGIWTVDQRRTSFKRLTNGGGNFSESPTFSPDGSTIAFWSGPQGGDLTLMDGDGGNQRVIASRVTMEGDRGERIAWTPDGSALSFGRTTGCAEATYCKYRIATIKSDGNDLVTTRVRGIDVAYSPAGRWMAVERGGCGGIDEMPVSGGRRQPLVVSTRSGKQCLHGGFEPAYSPDGRNLAFIDITIHPFRTTIVSRLAVMNLRTRKVRQLAWATGAPSWSPDGRFIVFENPQGVFVVGSSGGRARRVVWGGEGPSWQAVPK